MKEISTSIDIDAPPERVWAVISDVERWAEWTASIRRIVRLDSGPFRVGSRARVEQPKLAPATWEVTQLEENRGFDWASSSPVYRVLGGHWIERRGAGSRVTLSVQYSGLLGPLLAILFGGITGRYVKMEAEGLKQRAKG